MIATRARVSGWHSQRDAGNEKQADFEWGETSAAQYEKNSYTPTIVKHRRQMILERHKAQ